MNSTPKLLLSFSILGVGLAHSATTLYSSNSDFTGGNNGVNNVSVVNWVAVYGRTESPAQNTTGAVSTSANQYKAGYNKGSNGSLTDYVYLQKNGGDTDMDYFLHTGSGSSLTSFAPDDYSDGLTASWIKSGETFDNGFASVLVNGTWYSSTTDFGDGENPTFDFLVGSWNVINDDSGSPLSIGGTATTSAALFAGETIDGFGFYIENFTGSASGNKTVRFDNIVIEGVPELSRALLGLTGLGALLLLRRR